MAGHRAGGVPTTLFFLLRPDFWRERGELLSLLSWSVFLEREGMLKNERTGPLFAFYRRTRTGRFSWTGPVHTVSLSFPLYPLILIMWLCFVSFFKSCVYYLLCSHVTSRLGRWISDPTSQDALGRIHVFLSYSTALCSLFVAPFD